MTTVSVQKHEELMELWTESWEDGQWTLTERKAFEAAMTDSYGHLVSVDENTAISVAVLRLGAESPRVERLMGERRARLRLVVSNDHLAISGD